MLAVPQPCHENWAAMTPDAQGRHCAACNKVVLDFTQKTDAEILALLQRTAAPCGRFRADQLGRPLLVPPVPAPRWRTWLAATAAVLGLREVAAEQGHGQHPTAVHHDLLTHDERKTAAPEQGKLAVDTTNHVLHGRITDGVTGEGQPGVTVLLKNTTVGTSSGADGSFRLQLPDAVAPDQLVQFSLIGFAQETRRLDTMLGQQTLVALTYDRQLLGELVTVGSVAPAYPRYTPRGFWQWLAKPFRQL
jgi:hypothetical protein